MTLYAPAIAERAVTRIRILLAEMPRLLHEILASVIAAQPDMELVVSRDEHEALAETLRRGDPDVVVVGDEHGIDAAKLAELLYRHPRLRLLAVSGDGRDVMLYELRPHEVAVRDVSPQVLVNVIRASAGGAS